MRCLWRRWCSGRRRARPPARLGVLTAFGAAPRSPPVPFGPSGALHTSGAWCAGVWLGAPARCPARPCHRLRNFARNSPATLSNIESRSLELQRFQTLLKLRSIELRAKLRGRGSSPQWCANWCIACLCGATCCRAETAITFARPECVFLWHCGRAKVSLVSCVPVNERAKAVAVSFGREKVRPAALCHRESAKKFALQAQNGRKTLFSGALGEFFAEMPVEGPCWANFF